MNGVTQVPNYRGGGTRTLQSVTEYEKILPWKIQKPKK
jgi:hypothetical protein